VTGPLGHIAVLLALLCAGAGAVIAFLGGRPGGERFLLAGRRAAFIMAGFVAVAFLTMEVALVRHDFSVSYVAQVGSRETPLFYTIISLWSALEGSILLWALILAVYTTLVARSIGKTAQPGRDVAYSLGTLLLVNVFFLIMIAFPANPFQATPPPVPANGPGPNPLLQNHVFMGIHPPLLYIGYVGMAVPFSFAFGSLLAGRQDPEWPRKIRRWTIVPWGFLSLGIMAGAWWSYEVLGWGGYWAWDPVENASFMPWLTATAFLHSVMVQERRGMLKTWTMTLIISTFLLTLLGTFITRSGVLASVHAFTEGVIGPFFLSFLGIVLLSSLVLLAWRGETLQSTGTLDSPLSRETAFLANNLLFTGFAFTVLLGTMFPLVSEAARGVKVSVGAPYFNQMSVPIALALVFLAGVGPALPWRKGSPGLVGQKFLWPGVLAGVTGLVVPFLGIREPLVWLTVVLAALAVGLLAGEVLAPAAVRRARGEGALRAIVGVATGNRRRYGGYIVHLGVLLAAVGIAVSSSYRQEAEWTIRAGQAGTIGNYAIQFDSVWAKTEPHRDAVIAGVTAFYKGDPIGQYYPRLNYYRIQREPIATPAVREHAREDLYLVLMAYDQQGAHATLKAIVSPLVVWIWVGGVVMGLGVIFGLWPRGRRPVEGVDSEVPDRTRREAAGVGVAK
jgi:cytochrome c-type biogenesis protein CcmF